MAVPERPATAVEPDLAFVRDIRSLGGDRVKQCYQCATCSVVCRVTPAEHPFPRKEMLWAQWGLRDRLEADPDIWLCHGCGDCTVSCPRDADPAGLMAALRSQAVARWSVPAFAARLVSGPEWLPVLLALPIAIMIAAFAAAGGLRFPPGQIEYAHFVAEDAIDIAAACILGPIYLAAAWGLLRFWRALGAQMPVREGRPWPALGAVAGAILRHDSFRRCVAGRARTWQHVLVLYGFLLLFAASLGRAVYHYAFGYDLELGLGNLVKVAGNAGGVMVLVACGAMIAARLRRRAGFAKTTYGDWYLLWSLALTALTGFLTEISRLAAAGHAAYVVYLVHLVFVFTLLAYLPYSKLAHVIYRTLALLHAERLQRRPAGGTTP